MATVGDGRAPYESGGAGGKFRKRPFRRSVPVTPYDRPPTALRNKNRSLLTKIVDPASRLIYAGAHKLFDVFRKRLPPLPLKGQTETNEEPQNVPQESGGNVNNCTGGQEVSTDQGGNSASISTATGISELEQMLQQKTFTRSEIQRLTSLLHSRTSDDIVERDAAKPLSSPSSLLRLEASTSGSLKKYGEERDNFDAAISTPIVTSRVLEEEIASPAELAKSYMGSRPTKVAPSALGLTSQTLRRDSMLLPKMPVTPVASNTANNLKSLENGFMTPRSRGRTAMYSMARTPYSRSPTTFSQKGIRSDYGHGAASTSSQSALGDEGKMVLKRRSSLLEDDIGSGGPLRRVRQKANLFPLRDKKELGYTSFQQPDVVNQKLLLTNKPEPKVSGYASVPTKSTQTANKILQHLEKTSLNEKSSGSTHVGMREKSPNELTLDMLHGQALRSLEKVDSPKYLRSPHDIQKLEVQQHTRLHESREPTSQIKDKIEENGSRKFPIPRNMLTSLDGGSTTDSIKDKSPIVGNTDLAPKVTAEPPQKKRAFQMSAPEDSFEIDDDIHDNGHVSFPSAEISKPETSLAVNKPAAADIMEASKPAEVPRTPALVENNKPVFPEVTKVQEESELKAAQNAASSPNSDVGIGGSVTGQGIGFKHSSSPPSTTTTTTTTQTSVALQSTLEKEKVAPEKDSNSFSFGTGVEKVSPVQFYANESSESQQNACSDPKAHDSISVFNSVTKNAHVKFSAPSKDEIGNGNGNWNDQKSANIFGKSVAPAVPAATTSGSFLFGNPTPNLSAPNTTPASSPLAFSSSASVVNTNPVYNNSSPNVTSASTATTTAGAIFSTSVPTSVFGFGSVTSTSSTTSITETGNSNAINGKEPKLNMTTSPFATSLATTTTTAGSGVFGFSSPAAASTTTTTTTGSGLFGFSSSAANSTTTTTVGSGLFGFSSPAATSTTITTGSGLFGFSSSAATSTSTTIGNGPFGFSSPAATSTTTPTTGIGLFGFSSPAAISTTTTAQSHGSFFNITSGSQANTQASAAVSFAFGTSTPSSGSYSFNSSTPAFGSSPSFGNGSVAASSEGKSGNSTSGSTTTSIFGSTWQAPQQSSGFGSTFTSSPSSPVFSFGASSTPMFGSSNTTSSFMTAGTTNSSFAGPSVFGNSTPVFGASPNNNNNNDHMSMEDSMAEDSMQTPSPVSSFGQAPVAAPGFMFGSATPTPSATPATVPFQFGGQPNQNPAQPQNPFQSSSLEFNAGGGSFSLGSGGDKSGRRMVRVNKNKNRKK